MTTDPSHSAHNSPITRIPRVTWPAICWVSIASVLSCTALAAGYWMGSNRSSSNPLPPILAASAATSDTLAVATGPISNDAEGVFFLDFITGDLQCLVYYPRAGTFGARYFTNVKPHLGVGGKNTQFLMVTGQAVVKSSSGAVRPGASLVYVTNANTGIFAAYAVPWNPSDESSGRVQSGPMIYAGGGPIRNFNVNAASQDKPAAIVDPNNNK